MGALHHTQAKLKVIRDCNATLNTLVIHNKVAIEWVHGHSGILGNENADNLTRKDNTGGTWDIDTLCCSSPPKQKQNSTQHEQIFP